MISEIEFQQFWAEMKELGDRINHLANIEADKAWKAFNSGGGSIPINREKIRLIQEQSDLIAKMLAKLTSAKNKKGSND
ncbi:MAG: hypothetical protein AAFQ68_21050 [Bacteroidota bacterium]